MNYIYGIHVYLQRQFSGQPKMKAAYSSGTMVLLYQCTWCHNTECDNMC